MVRTLFVRPKELVRFVWGRTKHVFFWLKIQNILKYPLNGISFLGRGLAFSTLGLVILSDGRGAAQANAASLSMEAATSQLNAISPDLILALGGLSIFLLVVSNYALWRRHNKFEKMAILDHLANDTETHTETHTVNDSRFQAELQCQQLGQIADQTKRAQIDAELNNRVKEEQLARICHDLRTPLNAVIGFSDLMRSEMFGPLGHDKYIEYAEHIGESGLDLLNTVDDMFELSNSTGTDQSAPEDIINALITASQAVDDCNVTDPVPAE